MMLFFISPNDGLPIYRQIVRQMKHAVASGRLGAGDKLPSLRELAAELVVNHLTVKKAYEILETEGIIRTERGRGTFVAQSTSGDLRRKGLLDLHMRAKELADAARLLGLEYDEFTSICDAMWSESEEGKP